MKWTEKEFIIAWGYYRKFGTKQSGEIFLKNLEYFRQLQDRDYENSRNTFAFKNMNIDALIKNQNKNTGGLIKSKLYKKIILDKGEEFAIQEYENIFKEIMKIVPSENISKFKLKSNHVYDVDLDDAEFTTKKLANVDYVSISLKEYLREVKKGLYRVPLFQRKFVWSKQMMISFLNSLNKGFPFGSITVWMDNEGGILSERNEIVEKYRNLKNNSTSYKTRWILDGQQRTTAIISLMVKIKNMSKNTKIIYSFSDAEFKALEKFDVNYIHASDLLNEEVKNIDIVEKYSIGLNDATLIVNEIRERILDQKLGVIEVHDANLNTAIDIFTEMNTTGKRLNLFDIINAKWQSPEIEYNLEEFIRDWTDSDNIIYKPDELTVAKSIYLALDRGNIKSKEIMKYKIDKKTIVSKLESIRDSLNRAHDFLINVMKFKPELMPSSNLIKFLTYAYAKNENKEFSADINLQIKNYVRNTCLSNMYSNSTDQKMHNNINEIDQIFSKTLDVKPQKTDPEMVLNTKYNDGSSRYLFILNILFRYAKSLENNESIPVTSSSKKSSTINIHHIIPKTLTFDGREVREMNYGDSLANLTPILEKENKNISNKYPGVYYHEYSQDNSMLNSTLTAMGINPKVISLIESNTNISVLESFWRDRAELISKLVNNQ